MASSIDKVPATTVPVTISNNQPITNHFLLGPLTAKNTTNTEIKTQETRNSGTPKSADLVTVTCADSTQASVSTTTASQNTSPQFVDITSSKVTTKFTDSPRQNSADAPQILGVLPFALNMDPRSAAVASKLVQNAIKDLKVQLQEKVESISARNPMFKSTGKTPNSAQSVKPLVNTTALVGNPSISAVETHPSSSKVVARSIASMSKPPPPVATPTSLPVVARPSTSALPSTSVSIGTVPSKPPPSPPKDSFSVRKAPRKQKSVINNQMLAAFLKLKKKFQPPVRKIQPKACMPMECPTYMTALEYSLRAAQNKLQPKDKNTIASLTSLNVKQVLDKFAISGNGLDTLEAMGCESQTCARTNPLVGASCARMIPLNYLHLKSKYKAKVSGRARLTACLNNQKAISLKPTLLKKSTSARIQVPSSKPGSSREPSTGVKTADYKKSRKRKQSLNNTEQLNDVIGKPSNSKKPCKETTYVRRMASLNASARVSVLMEQEKKPKSKSQSDSPEGISEQELEHLAKTGKYFAIHFSETEDSELDINKLGLLYNGSTVHPLACRVFYTIRPEGGLVMPRLITPLLVPCKKERVAMEVEKAMESAVPVKKRTKGNNGWSPVGSCIKSIEYKNDDGGFTNREYYIGIQRKSDRIFVRDTVSLSAGEGQNPYLGKISSIWREDDGELNMTLFWYYRHQEVENPTGIKFEENELLASQHHDVNSVACIEDKVYVLGLSEYCRYKAASQGPLSRGGVPVAPDKLFNEYLFADPSLVYLCHHGYNHIIGRIV